MNTFGQNLYNDLMALCQKKDLFFFHDRVLDDVTYRVFSYHFASYTDWLEPSALECRGVMFRVEGEEFRELVSISQPKIFNIYENPFVMDPDFSSVTHFEEKADGCFDRTKTIDLWDGSSKTIGEIVNNKLDVDVVGMDNSGNLVPSRVVGWKNNGPKDNWLQISYNNHSRGRGRLRVTDNHHVFINGEFKAIGEAVIGDTMLLKLVGPSDDVLHMIKASLLGDGCVYKNGSNCKYGESHGEKQKEYSMFLNECLGDSACKLYEAPASENRFSDECSYMVVSKTYEKLKKLRNEWYPNGTKIIPDDISWIDDRVVAKWYMDDGSIRKLKTVTDGAVFHTQGFSEEDVERLAIKLGEMYNVDAMVTYNKGWSIRLNTSNMKIFWSRISPYIISSMRYKIPEEYRNVNFLPIVTDNKEKYYTVSVTIDSINKPKMKQRVAGYDIQTSTENYFAGGILVHNSLMSTFLHKGELCMKSKTSLESIMATDAMDYINEDEQSALRDALDYVTKRGITVIMEWCDPKPESRIVLFYEHRQLRIFGMRCNKTGKMVEFDKNRIGDDRSEYAKLHAATIADYAVGRFYPDNAKEFVENIPDEHGVEGYIMVTSDMRIKIKTQWYVTQHKLKDSVTNEKALFCAVITGSSDDLKSVFHDNPGAIQVITEMEEFAFPLYTKFISNVEDYYAQNKHLDRKSYAIKGQTELSRQEFGCAMYRFLDKKVDFSAIMIKNAKLYTDQYKGSVVQGIEE